MNEQGTNNTSLGGTSEWVCKCGKRNHGNFCVACGYPRPKSEPVEAMHVGTNSVPSMAAISHTATNDNMNKESENSPIETNRNQWKPILLGAGFFALAAVAFFVTKNVDFAPKTSNHTAIEQTSAVADNPSKAPIPAAKEKNSEETRESSVGSVPKPAAVRKTPIQVLQAFHQNITNKRYREAYNYLSADFQNYVSYEGWAPGFRTTVSSSVSNVKIASQSDSQVVLTYILKAVDNPGGTRYFRGTATIIKTEDGWKIDEIMNKAQ